MPTLNQSIHLIECFALLPCLFTSHFDPFFLSTVLCCAKNVNLTIVHLKLLIFELRVKLSFPFTLIGSSHNILFVGCECKNMGVGGSLCLTEAVNPLRPNSDLSQTSHRNIKALSVGEVMRIDHSS